MREPSAGMVGCVCVHLGMGFARAGQGAWGSSQDWPISPAEGTFCPGRAIAYPSPPPTHCPLLCSCRGRPRSDEQTRARRCRQGTPRAWNGGASALRGRLRPPRWLPRGRHETRCLPRACACMFVCTCGGNRLGSGAPPPSPDPAQLLAPRWKAVSRSAEREAGPAEIGGELGPWDAGPKRRGWGPLSPDSSWRHRGSSPGGVQVLALEQRHEKAVGAVLHGVCRGRVCLLRHDAETKGAEHRASIFGATQQ